MDFKFKIALYNVITACIIHNFLEKRFSKQKNNERFDSKNGYHINFLSS